MCRRTTLNRSPALECVEERCLLSAATAELAPPALVESLLQTPPAPRTATAPTAALAPLHGADAAALAGPALHRQTHHKPRPRSTTFTILPASTALATPTAVVQVTNTTPTNPLPFVGFLGVVNNTTQNIPVDSFRVSVTGSTFVRHFPAAIWRPGQVLGFFAISTGSPFRFNLAGTEVTLNTSGSTSVPYNNSFNTTLGRLINAAAFNTRYMLVSQG